MRKATNDSRFGIKSKDNILTGLDFADDLALLDHSCYSMQFMTNVLKTYAEKSELRISDKT